MEKINIAELLKDCPKGMELDCTMYENVYFDKIYNEEDCLYPIGCYIISDNNRNSVNFTNYGGFNTHSNAKCVIFPKGKTTWEGFQRPFKDGDVVVCDVPYREHPQMFIFKDKKENNTLSTCYLMVDGDVLDLEGGSYYVTRLATEVEKAKLFQVIKENGYYWNAETKTLEKLVEPRFKVGDRIQGYGTHINYPIRVVRSLEWDRYRLDNGNYIKFGDEHAYKLLKFDITTLVPFESKVLVRDTDTDVWVGAFYSRYEPRRFYTIGTESYYYQCIPYEGNEHLHGTTNDCDDFYKNWEI